LKKSLINRKSFHKNFSKYFSSYNFILILILLIFLLLSSLQRADLIFINYYEGTSFSSTLENIQLLVIFAILLITIFFRNIIKKNYGGSILYLRLFVGGFVFYEELSFISSYFCKFCDSFNAQNELNLHNLFFFKNKILMELPFIDELYLMTVLFFSSIFLISWGSFFPFLKKIEGIFLEKRLSVIGSLFIIERITYIIFSKFDFMGFIDKNTPNLIHVEFLELHLYLVLLFDLLLKLKKISKDKNLNDKKK
jgi:hypothetical protein